MIKKKRSTLFRECVFRAATTVLRKSKKSTTISCFRCLEMLKNTIKDKIEEFMSLFAWYAVAFRDDYLNTLDLDAAIQQSIVKTNNKIMELVNEK